MKDIIKLLEEVSPKLDTYDARFMSKLETMLAILRTSGIISYTYSTVRALASAVGWGACTGIR